MPYGEGHESEGFLTWNPINVPPMFRKDPEPDPDPKTLTKRVKQIAQFLGANRVGIARLNRKWVYSETCRNIHSPDSPVTKRIVFREVDEPVETPVETGNPGASKWCINGMACLNSWIDSGASCTACQAVCPFTQPRYDIEAPSAVWDMEVPPFAIDFR